MLPWKQNLLLSTSASCFLIVSKKMKAFLFFLTLPTISASLLVNFENVFIIAAHNEDLSWLEPIVNRTIVYNKGEPIQDEELANKFLDVRSLLNVGRESHTYLTYVVDNYDNLPDVITFSQAKVNKQEHHQPLNTLLEITEQAKIFGGSKNYDICHINNFDAHHINTQFMNFFLMSDSKISSHS